ncbi:MAG: glutamate racemase, partial [Natronospirillum sp.]
GPAMRQRLPSEHFIYLGDTARVPYGTKSPESVTQYALQVVARLRRENIKMLVVACNTASALALPTIQAAIPDIPVIGVVDPGAEQALAVTRSGHVGVIATEGTVLRNAYANAMTARRPEIRVTSQACSLFVALVEEGWFEGELVEAIVQRYLEPLQGVEPPLDTLVLGCTHFPVLGPVIARVMGPSVQLVDSAQTTADVVARALRAAPVPAGQAGKVQFWVTDGPERFARVAATFFGEPVPANKVQLIDL